MAQIPFICPQDNPTESSTSTEEDALIRQTIQLLSEGENLFQNSEYSNLTDLVLLLGLTGAGKTTISIFLTDPSRLEAYDIGDRILIQDKKGHRISVNSTIVSQTIFPELLRDPQNRFTLCDLPGFGDTRSAAIEIANAWFIQRVASLTDRVKILLILNHSSVRSGQSRTSFKMLLDHITDLLPNTPKFSKSIAMVATKVERASKDPQRLIRGIGHFLQIANSSLDQVFPQEGKRRGAEAIIESLLTKSEAGNGTDFGRISYFRQPDDLGPIVEMPEVMEMRGHMLDVLQNNVGYTGVTPEDFKISLSPAAQLIITKVTGRYEEMVTGEIEKIGQIIQNRTGSQFKLASWSNYDLLLDTEARMKEWLANLSATSGRDEFINALSSSEDLPSGSEVKYIRTLVKNLNFLETFIQENKNYTTGTFPFIPWSHPLQVSADFITAKSLGMERSLDRQMRAYCENATIGLKQVYSRRVNIEETTPQGKLEKLSSLLQELTRTVPALFGSNSVNDFTRLLARIPEMITEPFDQSLNLTWTRVTRNGTRPSPFNLLSWTQPFRALAESLEEEKSRLEAGIREEIRRQELAELERQRIRAEAELAERLRLEKEKYERELEESRTSRAVLYEHRDYSGDSKTVALKSGDCVSWIWSDTWNDHITSISVRQGCVRIWEHTSCGGASMCVCHSISTLSDYSMKSRTNWNDEISSVSRCG